MEMKSRLRACEKGVQGGGNGNERGGKGVITLCIR